MPHPPNRNIFGVATLRVPRLSLSSGSIPKRRLAMSAFNLVRIFIYAAIFAWTLICLGISAHFAKVLVPSDLTRFIPFSIFVSGASLLIVSTLLISTLFKQRSLITTRVELACLSFLTVLWLALGTFLAKSAAAEADVACFDAEETNPVEFPGFTTDKFHAQYRVLEAFSLFNLVLAGIFLIFLLFLALREHIKGYRHVWLYPVPVYPWFGDGITGMHRLNSQKRDGLPMPATAGDRRRLGGTRASAEKAGYMVSEKERAEKKDHRNSAFWVWVDSPRPVAAAYVHDRYTRRDRMGRRDEDERNATRRASTRRKY